MQQRSLLLLPRRFLSQPVLEDIAGSCWVLVFFFSSFEKGLLELNLCMVSFPIGILVSAGTKYQVRITTAEFCPERVMLICTTTES